LDDGTLGLLAALEGCADTPGAGCLELDRLFDIVFEVETDTDNDAVTDSDLEGDNDVPGGGVSVADGVSLDVGVNEPDGRREADTLFVAVRDPGEDVTDRVTVGVRVNELPFDGVID
jgi:hypothetical protein